MLYPKLSDLVSKAGSRYHLVNIVSKRAREIVDEANDHGIKLEQKPVKLAILEHYSQKDVKMYKQADYKEMVRDNVVFMPSESAFDEREHDTVHGRDHEMDEEDDEREEV